MSLLVPQEAQNHSGFKPLRPFAIYETFSKTSLVRAERAVKYIILLLRNVQGSLTLIFRTMKGISWPIRTVTA